jgi:DNA polymerase-3 subunit epsilon
MDIACIYPGISLFIARKGSVVAMIYKNTCVFDFETTGIDKILDRPVEVAALRVQNGVITGRYETLMNPGMDIPAGATAVNHITNEMVAPCRGVSQALADLYTFIGDAELLIGHNVTFDLGFLYRWLSIQYPFLDTMAMSIAAFPYTSHRLSALCQRLGVEHKDAHRAMGDVEATWECAKRLWERPEIKMNATYGGQEGFRNLVIGFNKYKDSPPFCPKNGRLVFV